MSLYRCNAILFDVEDKFQESETIEVTTGLDSSVTAAIYFPGGIFLVINIALLRPAIKFQR